MNVALLFTSFLSGLLTVIAPCILPLLPVIVGGALIDKNKWRPLVISLSLAISIVAFTLLLKFFTIFIEVPQEFWRYFSGGTVFIFGMFLVFPAWWDYLAVKLKFSQESDRLLQKTTVNKSLWGAVLLGIALGPVFSSCSPTYFVILATVLPVSFANGLLYLSVYALGLALMLLMIAYLGRTLTSRLKFAANPRGWFKRGLGLLLLLVGVFVFTGWDKIVEEKILAAGYGVTTLEKDLLDNLQKKKVFAPLVVKSENGKVEMQSSLPNYGPAPELIGLENWINSDPLTLKSLRGKVVLIDFWTYSCINCIRTLPYLVSWNNKYADQGLVIIGVHAPEFQFEKKVENVQKAVKERGLRYPVVQDNDFQTWRAFDNHYWPAKYLIDKEGNVRYYHFGEGEYEQTEMVINQLLGMEGNDLVSSKVVAEKSQQGGITQETYLGTNRRSGMVLPNQKLSSGQWTVMNDWASDPEKIVTRGSGSAHSFKFFASTANLVMGGKGTAKVIVDGKLLTADQGAGQDVKDGVITVDGERLYRITDFKDLYSEHLVEITFDQADIDLYAWTFG